MMGRGNNKFPWGCGRNGRSSGCVEGVVKETKETMRMRISCYE